MISFDTTIDMIQSSKKEFVKFFVRNDSMAESLNQFIDAQTIFTKSAVKATTDSYKFMSEEMGKQIKEATKFDYANLSKSFFDKNSKS